jgi:hypothetical protein
MKKYKRIFKELTELFVVFLLYYKYNKNSLEEDK